MTKDRFNELNGIFQRMSVKNKLKLIEFMAEDISLYDEDECDRKYLKTANRLLNCMKERLHSQKKDEEYAEIMTIIGTLSVEQLMDLLSEVSKLVREFDADNKHNEAVSLCDEEGHIFQEWRKHEYTRYVSPLEAYGMEGLAAPNPHSPTIPIPIPEWIRTCERCGFEEIVEREPPEVRNARLAKEKKARIRKLKKELRKLENSED